MVGEEGSVSFAISCCLFYSKIVLNKLKADIVDAFGFRRGRKEKVLRFILVSGCEGTVYPVCSGMGAVRGIEGVLR